MSDESSKRDHQSRFEGQGSWRLNFRCEVVSGTAIADAISIRQRVYIEEYGFELGGTAYDELDDRALHLLASTSDGAAVGAVRLIDQRHRPFEIDAFLAIDELVPARCHLAEITRLCILPSFRKMSADNCVHFAILDAILNLARQLDVTDIIASTRADLMPLYTYLLFQTFPGAVYRHPEIGHTEHTLMRLDLTTLRERYERWRPALYRSLRSSLDALVHPD